MVKVNYDATGKILGFYPDSIEYKIIPIPYIEITEEKYKKVFANMAHYRVCNKEIVDIKNNEDYLLEQSLYENSRQIAKIKAQIEDLEISQNRAIREYILTSTKKSKKIIADIETKIKYLREKMQAIPI